MIRVDQAIALSLAVIAAVLVYCLATGTSL